MGDSGATRILLTERAARLFASKEFSPRDHPMEVIYGGGEKGTVVSKVQLGEVEALVVPDISLADFADRGSTIMLTADGGAIANSCNDKQIVLTKDF